MPDIHEVDARIRWAEYHFQCLEKESVAYLRAGVWIKTEGEPDRHVYRARLSTPPNVELALRTADVLHHLRAALDNVVWILHPNGSKRTQFPVASTEENWPKVESQIAGLPTEVVTAIRDLQPFAADGLGDDLIQLNDLAARDRHRLPQLLVAATLRAEIGLAGSAPPDPPMPNISLAVLEDLAVVGSWPREGYWADHDLPAVHFDRDLLFGPNTEAPLRPVRVALATYQTLVDQALRRLAEFL